MLPTLNTTVEPRKLELPREIEITSCNQGFELERFEQKDQKKLIDSRVRGIISLCW